MTKSGKEEGSMLLEVLVAFVILAGAMILSLRIFADGMKGIETAEQHSAMAAIVRREIAQLEISPNLQVGTFAASDEDFVWTIETAPLTEPPAGGRDAVAPFHVKVMVGTRSKPGIYPVSAETILLAAPRQ